MENKDNLKVGDVVRVSGHRAEIWNLLKDPSNCNPAMIKVLMLEGPAEGGVFPVILKQVA